MKMLALVTLSLALVLGLRAEGGGRFLKRVVAQNVVGTIQVTTEGMTGKYLGCSIEKDGKVIDMEAIQVTENGDIMIPVIRDFDRFVISVWEGRIQKKFCKLKKGKPCDDCKHNGYHMDGLAETTGWLNGTVAWGDF